MSQKWGAPRPTKQKHLFPPDEAPVLDNFLDCPPQATAWWGQAVGAGPGPSTLSHQGMNREVQRLVLCHTARE